jgi:hypothetical protein
MTCPICSAQLLSEVELKHNKCWVCFHLYMAVKTKLDRKLEEAKKDKDAKYD